MMVCTLFGSVNGRMVALEVSADTYDRLTEFRIRQKLSQAGLLRWLLGKTPRGTPFDEQAALRALESLQEGIAGP